MDLRREHVKLRLHIARTIEQKSGVGRMGTSYLGRDVLGLLGVREIGAHTHTAPAIPSTTTADAVFIRTPDIVVSD